MQINSVLDAYTTLGLVRMQIFVTKSFLVLIFKFSLNEIRLMFLPVLNHVKHS